MNNISTPQVLDQSNILEFLESVDTFLFDCDGKWIMNCNLNELSVLNLDVKGVLWTNNEVITGVPETLKYLRSLGKRIIFVTNNSSLSRNQYVEKMKSFDIECNKEDIFPTSYAMGLYLNELNFDKKAYVVGSSGFASELEEMNIRCRGVLEHAKLFMTLQDANDIEIDPEIGAVVVGFDINICYYKLAYAFKHLQNENCLFLATNTDTTFPSSGGQLLPGGGSIVKMIESCTNREATVVGKPSQWFLDTIVKKLSLDRSRTVMVGDRLDTDILFGNIGNLRTLLVFTGVTSEEELFSERNTIFPHYTLQSISDILQLVEE